MSSKKEEILHLKICDWLRKNYPEALFRTDFSSGMKMTPGQAAKHKKFQKSRAWPDLFIAEPRYSFESPKFEHFGGLFLEIKAENVVLLKKDGTLRKNKHIEEQQQMLNWLVDRGYHATFAVGFEDAKKKIIDYLGKPKERKVEF